MKKVLLLFGFLIIAVNIYSQGFKVRAEGVQVFSFNDNNGRNQATFFSTTPLEDVNGLTTEINGTISFDVKNVAGSLKGQITIPAESLKTGIKKRDEDMKGSGWLDAEEFPVISFTIKKVLELKSLADNKLQAKVSGDFMVHGITKEIVVDAALIYLDENEQTGKISPGDLLGVTSKFTITLSDYGIDNIVLGRRVSDKIEIGVNFVGHGS
ncbi:MAG TPA: YceI family protein [Ignavibacteriaceae bacterium]|nr:YceI family protein [Ignavibacteriaceae bacterium]